MHRKYCLTNVVTSRTDNAIINKIFAALQFNEQLNIFYIKLPKNIYYNFHIILSHVNNYNMNSVYLYLIKYTFHTTPFAMSYMFYDTLRGSICNRNIVMRI